MAQQYRYLYLVSVVVNVLYKRHFQNTISFTAIAQNESDGTIRLDRTCRACLFHVDNDRYVKYTKDTMRDLQMNKQVVRDTRLQCPAGVFTKDINN